MKLWEPSAEKRQQANLSRLMKQVEQRYSLSFDDYHAFYQWTIHQPEQFWAACWDFFEVIVSRPYSRVLEDADRMPGARWFPGSQLNFSENLLRFRDDHTALVFWGEDKVRCHLSYAELYDATTRLAGFLREQGVTRGDRVAGFMPNLPETVIAMLATASLGAIWSSCSPDFGTEGVVERFGQIEPKVLITADGYFYKGRTFDCSQKVDQVLQAIPSIQNVVVVNYVGDVLGEEKSIEFSRRTDQWSDVLEASSNEKLDFEQVPFDHPLYIMFSSGTTGKPKCIVHSVGGTLLEHLKEHVLHTDVKRDDNMFYATTCGWMMWNWLVSGLATGATVVLYDGSPMLHGLQILFEMADAERVSVFGTSAGFISAIKKAGLKPADSHRLSALRAILSTGSTLAPECFDYVYHHIKGDICLSSISGGTDIIGCFALGCPLIPVYRGQLQARSLGYAVNVFDDHGKAVSGRKGELVCTAPFPSMPVSFWNDPDGSKYHRAYFERYQGVWHHGDYVMLTAQQGMIFYGRSDAVLMPGGVRIGTAEIYRLVETIGQGENSIVIEQEWNQDTRVVLFVQLSEGLALDDKLREHIQAVIREGATPRHVPAKIIEVADIPVTRSGKISELAVKNMVHGRPVKNAQALANPESLQCFRDLDELT